MEEYLSLHTILYYGGGALLCYYTVSTVYTIHSYHSARSVIGIVHNPRDYEGLLEIRSKKEIRAGSTYQSAQ